MTTKQPIKGDHREGRKPVTTGSQFCTTSKPPGGLFGKQIKSTLKALKGMIRHDQSN